MPCGLAAMTRSRSIRPVALHESQGGGHRVETVTRAAVGVLLDASIADPSGPGVVRLLGLELGELVGEQAPGAAGPGRCRGRQ
jgi:hypothetical protein